MSIRVLRCNKTLESSLGMMKMVTSHTTRPNLLLKCMLKSNVWILMRHLLMWRGRKLSTKFIHKMISKNISYNSSELVPSSMTMITEVHFHHALSSQIPTDNEVSIEGKSRVVPSRIL